MVPKRLAAHLPHLPHLPHLQRGLDDGVGGELCKSPDHRYAGGT